jgi:hypothetical protein
MTEHKDSDEICPPNEAIDKDRPKEQSFADFYISDDNPDKFLAPSKTSLSIGSAGVISALTSLPVPFGGTGLSQDKTEGFAQEAVETAHSKRFIETFSEQIGSPGEDETEDAFVRRAKSTMRELLRSCFRQK